ncbi:hypothetical protein GCM10011391_11100 [Pullulanibacillus camelliae]|uniref:Aspartyl-phosphate phosphatase Spo0E family protein n=1 Tax=Pullulanibacillus camelliae TaxID=1707096 RepID=A0A8J2VK99_9BACL|nr:aspartyl-phosphate phosphatase Spo0E family protein [Pullulanibacillus camelliae]GGE34174.1 hypothetical protein GCM10011391_11100 [Pullulanibacillus camelliae]
MIDIRELDRSDLMKSITEKRREMLEVAKLRGLKNNETVQQSRELDSLIIVYQKRFFHHY